MGIADGIGRRGESSSAQGAQGGHRGTWGVTSGTRLANLRGQGVVAHFDRTSTTKVTLRLGSGQAPSHEGKAKPKSLRATSWFGLFLGAHRQIEPLPAIARAGFFLRNPS